MIKSNPVSEREVTRRDPPCFGVIFDTTPISLTNVNEHGPPFGNYTPNRKLHIWPHSEINIGCNKNTHCFNRPCGQKKKRRYKKNINFLIFFWIALLKIFHPSILISTPPLGYDKIEGSTIVSSGYIPCCGCLGSPSALAA